MDTQNSDRPTVGFTAASLAELLAPPVPPRAIGHVNAAWLAPAEAGAVVLLEAPGFPWNLYVAFTRMHRRGVLGA